MWNLYHLNEIISLSVLVFRIRISVGSKLFAFVDDVFDYRCIIYHFVLWHSLSPQGGGYEFEKCFPREE